METYDPLKAPNPEKWLALRESERIALVASYYRRARIRVPNLQMHAMMHVIVENQAALGDETPVRRTLQRLMKERVDRHEALHAAASTLGDFIFAALNGKAPEGAVSAAYFGRLEELTIASWRRDFGLK